MSKKEKKEGLTTKQLEELYQRLAKVSANLSHASNRLHDVEEAENVTAVAFAAGKAYTSVIRANEELENILDEIYSQNDFEHYEDIAN